MESLTVDSKKIGTRLRALRGEKSLETVSQETGISRSALNMYELGERIPRDIRKIQLAQYYGVPVERLFFGND